MPVNPNRPDSVNRFVQKIPPSDPGFDPFVDFMGTLTDEQQEIIVKYMMARNISTLAPYWVAFAITADLIEKVEQAARTVTAPIAPAFQEINRAAENVNERPARRWRA